MSAEDSAHAPWELPSIELPVEVVGPSRWTLDVILDIDNLLDVFSRLRATKGQAPGIDGLLYDDLSRSEIARILCAVKRRVRSGDYHPLPLRLYEIPKNGGGYRQLRVQAVVDRVIAAAVEQALAPICEAEYSDISFGYRRGRDRLGLLARLSADIHRHRAYFVTELDIRDAFPSTSTANAVASYASLPIDGPVIDLIRASLNLETEAQGPSGLPQGHPLSPQIFNLLLTHLLDRPFTAASSGASLLRYADNLVIAASNESDVWSAQRQTADLLAVAGYQLKTPMAVPRDVRDPSVETSVLGYGIRYDCDQLTLHHSPESWQRLADLLREAHTTNHPIITAKAAVAGWLLDLGPTVEGAQRDTCLRRARDLAAKFGFRELGTTERLMEHLTRGAERWNSARLRERPKGNAGIVPPT